MSMVEAVFPPGASQRDWVADGCLAVSTTLVAVVPYIAMDPPPIGITGLVVLSAAFTLPLALRRHAPLLMLALCTMAGLLQLVFITHPTVSLIAVPIVAYSVARWVPGNIARSVIVVGAFASVLGPLRWDEGSAVANTSTDILFWGACMGAVLTPYAIGRRSREVAESRSAQVRAAEERYSLLLAERDQQTKLAEASTRAMIARELHDIVAHSLSVMIVQAEGGRAAAARNPEVAAQALDTVAETGREALHEMRRIVGVLRSDPRAPEPPDFSPMPTLDDIPDLVQRTSDRASLIVHGTPFAAPQALSLTIYRVTQEALTNFLKHAGPDAHAIVTLTYSRGSITVDVLDDGTGIEDPTDGGGNGLRGMYERVTSMGGTLKAGPLTGRPGFRVTASIPVRATAPTPW